VNNFDVNNGTSELFARGRDCDYVGLRPPEVIVEDIVQQPIGAREISRSEIFEERAVDDDLFDRDLGESSGCD